MGVEAELLLLLLFLVEELGGRYGTNALDKSLLSLIVLSEGESSIETWFYCVGLDKRKGRCEVDKGKGMAWNNGRNGILVSGK